MSTDDSTDTDEPRHPYETDESFHPMGKEWEDQMREELEDTDYDADLGMEMARDAQRLVAGEISEEEFYAEYHDDVKEEFETDERPIFDDLEGVDLDEFEDESMLESLADVDLSADDVSRRDMMSKMGAAGLFLGYSAFATYDNNGEDEVPEHVSGIRPADEDDREHRWGMTIDLERCDGCLACVTGCIDENGTSTGANWMYVFAYDDEQADTEEPNFLVRPCQHCSNAPCAKVCPVRARHTREKDGLVLTNYETCIGCRYCQVACPYGVNYFQWGDPDVEMGRIEHLDMSPSEVRDLDPGEGRQYGGRADYAEEGSERREALSEVNDHAYDDRGWWVDSRPPIGTMGKCTMCPSRQDGHTENPKGTVACQDACDAQGMSAIHFGDLDAEVGDDYDRAVRYLEERTTKSDEEDRTTKFDLNETFEVGEEIDFGDGYYSMHLVQRPDATEPWREFDSSSVLVSDSPMEEDADFADSRIQSFGTVPSASLQLLYTDQTQDISADVVYGGGFEEDEDGEPIPFDVTVSLRLGSEGDTLDSEQITVEPAEDEDPSQVVEFTVDGTELPRTEGTGVLYLVVEREEAEEPAAATHEGVYLTPERPNVETPEPGYRAVAGQQGTINEAPDVLFTELDGQEIDVTITYPQTADVVRDIGIVLFDGEQEDTIAEINYTYEQHRTSNTAWDSGISTFKLLEEIGTEPNITYIGNEPSPRANQDEDLHPVQYADLDNRWGVEVKDNRKEHLDYGAGGPSEGD